MNKIAEIAIPHVTLISKSEIYIDALLVSVDPYALANVDQCPVNFSKTARYLAAVSQKGDPVDALRNLKTQIMQTVHYTFAITSDRETLIDFQANSSRITVLRMESGFVGHNTILGTGPLLDWVETLIAGANIDARFTNRYIVNFIQLYLQRAEGLALLFDKYRQVSQPDGTFILERK